MNINEQRNLVIPLATEKVTRSVTRKVDGKDITEPVTEDVVRLYAYHTPVSKDIFDANFRVLAATKAVLAGKGSHYLITTAPRIALLTLKDEGRKDAIARGMVDAQGNVHDEMTPALLGEMKRLTMILAPGANGWDILPVDSAVSSGKMDAEDWEEALSSVAFFTCNYAMARKADRDTTARAYASLIDASITPSNATEFAASLPNSMPPAPTTATRSSIPS